MGENDSTLSTRSPQPRARMTTPSQIQTRRQVRAADALEAASTLLLEAMENQRITGSAHDATEVARNAVALAIRLHRRDTLEGE